MKPTEKMPVNDVSLIAFCGLYCGTCVKYKKGKCPGCKENAKATWCKIRTCNINNGFNNCAHCNVMGINECKKLNNIIGKAFKLVFKTDRLASIRFVKENGEEAYANEMCNLGQMSIKKGQNI